MKKTPKILPHLYKSKGTPIFRDTTALPFAKGGPLVEEPVTPTNPVNPISWNRPQLSPERIAALKELHQNSFFDKVNPNDLLFYDLNKDIIDQAADFGQFLDPSVKINSRFTDKEMTQDIKTRLIEQGWALDTKTGGILKVPDELREYITRPQPELMEKLEIERPELISRNIPTQLSLPPQPEVLQYQMPGYMKSYHFPTVGRYTPLAAKAVQKVTGYDRNFMEGYYDEEGNYVPGELENAREQNRVPQFQGASSFKDIFAQRAYQQALEESEKTKSFANGGTIHFERSEYGSDAREHYADGGPIKPPEVNFNYNPYNYNPNELVGYKGYGDLSGTSIEASTLDLLGRQNKVNALKVPLSVSVNKLYDPNTVNDTINYGYESTNIAASGIPGSVMQEEAQKQLDSAYQPYLSKSPLGFNIQTGVAGSGINPSIKKRSRYEMMFSGGYNPLSGFNAGVNSKLAFAAGNDFYRPLKKGDWRVAGNIQPLGMQFSQAPAYSEMQDVIQQNLQNTAETGEFNPTVPGFNGYSGKGYGSGTQVTFGAGLDAEAKLPLGTLVGGAGVKYNRAAGEAERLAPSAYLGYSIAGSELSNLGNKLPNINLPNRNKSNYETLAGQDLESEKGEWVQDAEGKFTWKDYPGFNGAFNASTLEGEDTYVPSQIAGPEAAPITIPLGEGTNQMSGGGPIYTYSKRPGSYYQRANDGSWMINNSSTGGQYVPIDDPTGQRTALLNKNAVVYNAPAQGAAKPVMNQAVWNKAQQQGKNDIAAQQMINASRKASGTEGLYMPDGSLRPQAAQAADWVPQALVAAPMALDVLGTAAAAEIPFTGGVNLGGAANAAGIAYGATQVDDRYQDWQNVASGKMDWKEAALKTGLTSLDFAGAGIPIKNATNIVKGINAPTKLKGQTLIGSPTKKVMGTIDEFGDYTNASGVTVHGGSSTIGLGKNLNKAKKTYNSEAPSISLEDWKEANKIANSTNQRFIIPKGEEEFLVNKYTEEFANKFGIPVEKVNPKDVGLYAKLKEAEFIPTRQTVPVEGQVFPDLSREIHTNFIQKHKPDFNLKKQEELVLDAYARGYDRSINLREPDLAAQFYQDEVAPILEQTILQNKFKEPQTLIRGTRNFDIENEASVIRNGETIEGIKFSDLQPGDLFVPKTFTSTSIVKDAPKTKLGFEEPLTGFTQRAENLDYVINAPAGQSYLYANASPIQQFPREMEAILPKDLQFKLDRVASDVERGYLTSMNDVQKGQLYKGFTKMPNKYFPSISSLDKVVDLKGKRIPKKQYPALIKHHNMLHQPSVPKYYFSIANPYLFGGRLNKNC